MSYITNYLRKVLPKQEEIDYVHFKLNFCGGYALKVVIDGYNTIIDGKYSVDIDESELKECIIFLKDNNYIIDKHSVVDFKYIKGD